MPVKKPHTTAFFCFHYYYRLMEVLDKGKAAAVTTLIETRDKRSGKVIFENQMTVFIRGAGGFGGRRAGKGVWRNEGATKKNYIDLRSPYY
jgi:hypothetical protein